MPREAVEALRAVGHDVVWMTEHDDAGASDLFVLAKAAAENRVLLTSDKDFGELAFQVGAPAVDGIVLIRARESRLVADLAIAAFDGEPDLRRKFVVVEPGRPPRIRAVPP